MDPPYADPRCEDSYSLHPRSRASSSVSSADFRRALTATDSPRSIPIDISRPPSAQSLAPSQAYISPNLRHAVAYLPTPVSQTAQSSPCPPLLDDVLDQDWFDIESRNPQAQPLLRVEQADLFSRQTPSSSPPLPTRPANMSAVATLHFDPVFGMGSRSTLTWPGTLPFLSLPRRIMAGGEGTWASLTHDAVIDSSSALLSQDLSSYAAEASLTPPSGSRSVTASPPRGALTPEQRELKRQRDQARRDSKTAMRLQRANSGSSSYMASPPVSMAELTGSPALPVYTNSPQISLLAEPATTLSQSPYLPSYSPPLSDHSQSIFPSSYQQSYMADYTYATTAAPGIAAQYGYVRPRVISHRCCPLLSANHEPNRRPTMPVGQDASLMYGMPPVMGHGAGHAQDQSGVRVVQTRPKPQCWEHGCNGRQFSTFSNLLRHQREKSGQAAKVSCPNCGAEFTRTTARNGHLQHDKCKQRRSQNSTSSTSSASNSVSS